MRARCRLLPCGLRGLFTALAAVAGLSAAGRAATSATPTFTNVSVHDPSIVRDGSTYYVFGSHLASAKSTDLMHWTQLSTGPAAGNLLVPNPAKEFAEALAWAQTTTFWAPDNLKLSDGLYHFYYCACKGDSPRSALGIATSKSITGPYVNQQIILKSGMWGQTSPDGTIYDATKHPNVVDPAVFFDATGKKLWMVYGSYSGGIFILELDPKTGVPKAGQGYGRKLIGGNHARIEGPYVIYNPDTKYYYLFLSFGGLAADGGYNLRVGRSRAPNGPYVDSAGYALSKVAGAVGTVFDDASIAPHGVKLIGNCQFLHVAGEAGNASTGYVSPGHNSVYRNPATGEFFIVFHTRFVGRGEQHEVRVHPLYFNADGWPVIAPHRYAGERMERAVASRIPGRYKLINHGKDITAAVKTSVVIELTSDHKIAGAATGTWALSGEASATLKLAGTTYHGVFARQWDEDNQRWVQTFTALSASGVAIWGSQVAVPVRNTAPTITTLASRTIAKNHGTGTLTFTVGDAEVVASALKVTAASSNLALVPASRLALGGTADLRTLRLTPVAGKTGKAKITLTVSDGALKKSTSFTLTVANAPTIGKIANQTIVAGTATKALAFKVADADTAATKLKVAGASSNTALLPAKGIVLAGSGANRTVTLTPTKGKTGAATVTLAVSDGALTATTTFTLTVKAASASSVRAKSTGVAAPAPPSGATTAAASGEGTAAAPARTDAPGLTAELADAAALAGRAASLTVRASGPGLRYQWFKDGAKLAAATATLNLPAVAAADAGAYRVVVTNAAGAATSRTASLVVVTLQTALTPLPGTGVTRLTQRLALAGRGEGLTVSVLLPAGWRYRSGDAAGASAKPAPGDTDLLEWTWPAPPAAVTIESLLSAPTSGASLAPLQGALLLRQARGTTTLPFEADR